MAFNFDKYIATYPDFPKKGILFRDITPLTENGNAFRQTVNKIADFVKSKNADLVVAPEARGFIIGCPVAYKLGIGFSPARKEGKLPGKKVSASYGLEYGKSTLYMNQSAVKPGQKVVVIDDLLATGGTIGATIKMVKELGGKVVGAAFIIELSELNGRNKMNDCDVLSLVKY
ncbi:adenine phosphoribosyltransferase [Philodulcilactobacillus myokoensis]|uniref:Adenine phosphoribosyltransferase n=1 Tax=Philodulcilactobacillus myokoensis TaxID=2929573 RepID=A0A9W6ESN4_9LACO|nr:adenine phosphoribosyltransferase [Philodulcilactobacillus myokoensis]GLB46970.1 adenine phosphoribosyltransferase [Philodulcilactobacillus myokoensis]